MAVLCERHNLLFLPNPRTGSKAITKALISSALGVRLPKATDVGPGSRPYHTTLPDLKKLGLLSAEQCQRLLKVTGIRNPYDGAASMYQKRLNWAAVEAPPSWFGPEERQMQAEFEQRSVSFKEWVIWYFSGRNRRSQNLMWAGWADRVYRYENLNEHVSAIFAEVGITKLDLPQVNVTQGKRTYRDYYCDETRRIVEDTYGEDLRRFGYTF